MKKFILKSSVFIFPFSILYLLTFFFLSVDEQPDLIRLGKIPFIHRFYSINNNDANPHIYYTTFINNKNLNKEFKIVTIGDSFSEQGAFGYKNIIAKHHSLLHIDRYYGENPLQTLINLTNGDFFDQYNVQYLILQCVERKFIEWSEDINLKSRTNINELDTFISKGIQENFLFKPQKNNFFCKETLIFPLYNIPRYIFKQNYLSNNFVWNVALTKKQFFGIENNNLLFLNNDLIATKKNNKKNNIIRLNEQLNLVAKKLEKRGIKLIVLPAPDKYSLYYDYIEEKDKFEKPLFLSILSSLDKNYLYIDTKKLLLKEIDTKKELYYFGDTHWSFVSSKLIGDEINKLIKNAEN
jgi:hypothetical protein